MKITTKIKDPFTLGQIIQQSRLQQGLSQRQLAKELGANQKWVWEMEQGKPGILMDRLFKTLDTVGVELFAEFEVTDDLVNEQLADEHQETKEVPNNSLKENINGKYHEQA